MEQSPAMEIPHRIEEVKKDASHKGVVGIQNMGNTCFIGQLQGQLTARRDPTYRYKT